jgi:hypothetical protein
MVRGLLIVLHVPRASGWILLDSIGRRPGVDQLLLVSAKQMTEADQQEAEKTGLPLEFRL